MEKRLYRSRTDRMIWGVCGGLAKYFNSDPTIIRIIALLTIFFGGAGILAYVILAIVVPVESSKATEPKDVIKENVAEMKETATDLGREISSTFKKDEGNKDKPEAGGSTGRGLWNIVGILVIVIGVLALLGAFGILEWFTWAKLWPLVLVVIGVLIILGARRR